MCILQNSWLETVRFISSQLEPAPNMFFFFSQKLPLPYRKLASMGTKVLRSRIADTFYISSTINTRRNIKVILFLWWFFGLFWCLGWNNFRACIKHKIQGIIISSKMGLYVSWAPITKKIFYKGKSTLKEEDNEQQKKELTCVIIQKKERYLLKEVSCLTHSKAEALLNQISSGAKVTAIIYRHNQKWKFP